MREKRDLLCASICDQRIPEITGDDSVNSCTSSFVTRNFRQRSFLLSFAKRNGYQRLIKLFVASCSVVSHHENEMKDNCLN